MLAGLLLGWLVYAYGMFHTVIPNTLVAVYRTRLCYWAVRSMKGNLTAALTLFGIPMTLLGIQLNLTREH